MRPHSPVIATVGFERWRHLLALLAAAIAIAFAWLTPLGEAPDELAHIRYAESIAGGRLPSAIPSDLEAYESHQPPLGYLLPGMVIALRGGLNIHPERNLGFVFERPGSRAFASPFASPRDALTLRLARTSQAFWAAPTVSIGLLLATDSRAAAPILLAPQLLFVCGTINNGAPLIAAVSCTLLFLVGFVTAGRGAATAALCATAAFFIKASALLLVVPIAVALLIGPPRHIEGERRRSARLVLASLAGAGVIAWMAWHEFRFGAWLPRIPTSSHIATLQELMADPRWIAGLARSFWAKFGWLNTPMPSLFYVWFAALSLAACFGVNKLPPPRRAILATAGVANLALLLIYLLTVDLQAQGRYLLPSLTALAAFASASPIGRFGRALLPLAIFTAISALLTIALAYK